MPSSRTCVGVVFGGASEEHAVSIRSAITVVGALRSGVNNNRFEVIAIYIDQLGRWWPACVAEAVLKQGHPAKPEQLSMPLAPQGFTKLPEGSEMVQVWYPVLHGPNGEDGTVQGLFTLTGKPFVGSGVLGSALSMDKLAMKAAFATAGLPQVPYAAVDAADLIGTESRQAVAKHLEAKLKYPCFVKPANLGSSVGISKAQNRNELLIGLDTAARLDRRIVVEQGVSARELECAVLGKRELQTSVVGEICFDADWYDYDTKYSENCSHTLIPAPLPEGVEAHIRTLALQACRCVAAHGMARVDFFYDDARNAIWLNEINTLPGFTSQSMYPMLWEASGVTLEELVSQLVVAAGE